MLHSNNFWYSLPLRLNISRRESTFIQDLIRKRCGTAPVRCSPPAVSPYKYEIGAFGFWMKDKYCIRWVIRHIWARFYHKQSLRKPVKNKKRRGFCQFISDTRPLVAHLSQCKKPSRKSYANKKKRSTAFRIFRDRKSDIVWHLTSKTGGRSPKAAAVAPLRHISRLKNRSQTSSWTEMPRMRKDTTEGQRPMIKMSS